MLREILWNIRPIEDLENWPKLSLKIFLLYEGGRILYEEFVSLIKILSSKGIIERELLPYYISILVDWNENWFYQQKQWHYELAFGIPHLPDLVEAFSKINPNDDVPENIKTLSSLVSTIRKRPEDFFSHIEEYPTKILQDLLDWTNPEHNVKISNEILKRKMTKYKSWEEVDKDFENDEFLGEFPTSFNVLGENIREIGQVPFDSELATKIPQNLLMDWLPKFTFSRPQTEERISLHFPGGPHIGHSSILVKAKHGMILLDFGMSVLNNRIPQWNHILSKVDAIFLSHAHLDHSGALPIFQSIAPKVPIFATKETKLLSEILWNDTANVLKSTWDKKALQSNFFLNELIREKNIISALQNITEIEIGQSLSVLPNLEITPYHASHLFGSVGFDINFGGKRIFYTGDFNADGTPYFSGAKFPIEDQKALLFDGTYYGRYTDPVNNSEIINEMLREHNRLLIPAFSVGRTQEVLYQLLKQELDPKWKIYVAGMGVKVIRKLQFNFNPNGRKNKIEMVPTIEPEDFTENTIVISGNGMLQAGTIRKLLDATAQDEETGVILTGYQAPNTLGFQLLTGNEKIKSLYRQRVAKVSLSGHTSAQTLEHILQDFSGMKVIVHSPRGTGKESGPEVKTPEKLKNYVL